MFLYGFSLSHFSSSHFSYGSSIVSQYLFTREDDVITSLFLSTRYEFVSQVHSAPRPKPRPKQRPAPGSSAADTPPPAQGGKSRRSKEGSEGTSTSATEAAIAAAKAKKEARDKAAAETEASKNAQSEPVGEESIEAVANGGKDSKSGQIEVRYRISLPCCAVTRVNAFHTQCMHLYVAYTYSLMFMWCSCHCFLCCIS
jgi:hypothetical protein